MCKKKIGLVKYKNYSDWFDILFFNLNLNYKNIYIKY